MAQKIPEKKGKSRSEVRYTFLAVTALTLVCLMLVVPQQVNRGIDALNNATNVGVPRLPETTFNLGLDLQGGAHLIYEAKTDQIPEEDRTSSVEGVRDVIERRVRGGLGVAEPLVQTTRVGEAYRIIVELPGVTDVNQAISMIGATPILEFKEENKEPPRDLTAAEQKELNDYNAAARKKINEALAAARRTNADFASLVELYSEDATTKDAGGDMGFVSKDVFPTIHEWAAANSVNTVSRTVIESASGLNVLKKLEERDAGKEVSASHLLICYKGAAGCTSELSKEAAQEKINELKEQATIQNFTSLVKEHSTEPGAAERGGDLGTFKKGTMVEAFENAVWDAPVNSIVGPVETEFGFHLIYKKTENQLKEYRVARIFVPTKDKTDIVPPQDAWKFAGLSGKQLERAEVVQDPTTGQVQVSLRFNPEGSQLFADITGRNIGKQVAIFLDNEPISIPTVNEAITSGEAMISGGFTFNEARLLAQRLNSGALPVPVELLSQQKVDATLGADSLAKSFRAGVIGLLLVMLYMTLYYRLPGFLSVISLAVYVVITLAIFKVLGVTLTLAGIAGFILSIGVAVDANVLVFERLKEELRNGRTLKKALEEAFLRAWPSIRDGHVATLISSIVLMWFGTGFIQGFAVVLAIGILMSLFSAITVTRTLLRLVVPFIKDEGNVLFLGYKRK